MADEAAKDPMTLPAEDRIRETAKWLTVSLAAIGAVVINGTQFSTVGAVQFGSGRFFLALVAAVVVAVGAGIILLAAVRTATTRPVDLEDVKTDGMANKIALLEGIEGGAPELAAEFKKALDERDAAIRYNLDHPSDSAGYEMAKVADARAQHLSKIVAKVARMNSYESVADKWAGDSKVILSGAILSLAGLLIFIWAINPPKAVAASEASPTVVGEAAIRILTLTPEGQAALASKLGAKCDATKPLSVAHLDSTDTGPDVLVQQQGCVPLRLIITDRWGEVKEPPPSLEKETTSS